MARLLVALGLLLLLHGRSEAEGPQILAGSCLDVNWKAPVNTSDLAEYRIYLTRVKGKYNFAKPSASPVKKDTVSPCPTKKAMRAGQWWLVMKSIDTEGRVSSNSNELPFEIIAPDMTVPPPPGHVAVKALPDARMCRMTWTAPMSPDGTLAPNIAKYFVYVRKDSGTYDFSKPQARVKADGPLQTMCRSFKLLTDGRYAAVITAVGLNHQESVASDEVTFTRDTSPPPAPGAFTVIDRQPAQGEP